MFDCIVNADAPYPRFLSVQGLELIQKVITAGSRAGPGRCCGSWVARHHPSLRSWGPACLWYLRRRAVPGAKGSSERLSSCPAPPEVPGEAPGGR